MDTDLLLPLVSRWTHIGCAILLVGGTAFTYLVLQPVLKGENAELVDRIRNRWKKFVHPGILLFLISGLYNYIRDSEPQRRWFVPWSGRYQDAAGIGGVLFGVSAGRQPAG